MEKKKEMRNYNSKSFCFNGILVVTLLTKNNNNYHIIK